MAAMYWIGVYTFVHILCITGTSQSVEYPTTTEETEVDTEVLTVTTKPWKTHCPENCQCFKSKPPLIMNSMRYVNTVDCSNTGRTKLNIILPDTSEVLNLSNNNIPTLTQIPYSPNLASLDLSNSSIQLIDSYNMFAHFKKLKFLNMRSNSIQELKAASFSGLLALDKLDLSDNGLKTISKRAFAGLNHLKTLQLSGNSLRGLIPDWFHDVFDIRELDLSNNLLSSIQTTDLEALTKLNLLNLSGNIIRTIQQGAFSALTDLFILDLSQNLLQIVPKTSIEINKSLKKIILDKNPITRIHGGDFIDMNIVYISISYMSQLMFIEKSAFVNLPHFNTLEAHDNKKLIFIEAQAFENVTSLTTLYLHNNKLKTLSPSLVQFVPSLTQIHFYGNPIQCDCNALWIKELTMEASAYNSSKPFFNDSQYMKCDFPLSVNGLSIEKIDVKRLDRVCAPTTLPAFKESYTLDLGEELRLECHSFGVPEPEFSWILPNQTEIKDDIHSEKFEFVDRSLLIIRHLVTTDSGTYACKADNGIGVDLSSTRITVTNKPVRLLILSVSFDYVSLSWNGTSHSSMISDYQLHYVELKGDNEDNGTNLKEKTRVILLGPQYRSYTVTNLNSNTLYEFCIVYVYDTELYKVDCRKVKTQDKVKYHSAIHKIISEKIIAGVCTALGLIMAVACMVTLVKKFRLHKDYESPFSTDETESINIPLENVYGPTTAPMCSSKTSLLSVQTHRSGIEEY